MVNGDDGDYCGSWGYEMVVVCDDDGGERDGESGTVMARDDIDGVKVKEESKIKGLVLSEMEVRRRLCELVL
ncbi:hypothetical protein QVD17_11437 [Tagetes erecta]|uniref:Uncharacterized protein n=1 Tax=Tagetes erecta TaxID=13708 RepID=A0AAD8KY58_TARER|nr:hypothetical protein QVD17_11437 [Tagetes erecta]